MSFIVIQSKLCTPPIPNLSYYNDTIYCGLGTDTGKYAFSAYNLGHVISENLAYSLYVSDTGILNPQFNNVNGYIYWGLPYALHLYHSINYGWVMCSGKFPGYEPVEYYDSDESVYRGDSFWSSPSLPSWGGSISFSPRGSNRSGGSSRTVSMVWKRWRSNSNSKLGEYSPYDGATGKMYFGCPRWKDNDGVYYVRSVEKNDGTYTYGNIVYSDGKWIIGTVNNQNGWWEGSEPSKTGSVLFRFKVPAGSEVVGHDKTIFFHDYVMGDERKEIYLSEVAIWR